MDLRHLHYFLTVVKEGSVTSAATCLRITQPTLSRQLRNFERDLGWKLFERGARSLNLTCAGQVVAEEGRKLILDVDKSHEKMRQRIDGHAIRVAYAPSLGVEILKSALASFQEKHPQVRVELFDQNSGDMRRGVRAGSLDMMIEAKTGESDFEWRVLRRKSWRVAIRADDPLASQSEIRSTDLDGRRLLLFSRRDYPAYGESVAAYFRQEKINAKVAGEFDGVDSLYLGLQAGMGVALVVDSARFGEDMILLPLKPAPEDLLIAVAWKAETPLSSLCEDFIMELETAAR